MKPLILTSLILLASCSKFEPTAQLSPEDRAKMTEVNMYTAKFNNAYTQFNSTAILYGGDIPQSMGNLASLGTNIIGVCWYRSDGSRDIQYDRTWWDQLDPIQKQELVYHERGHCSLSRHHRCSNIDPDNSIQSIMYPDIGDTWTLSIPGRFDYMSAELFDRASQLINDCPTEQIKRQTNQDLPNVDSYQDIFSR